MRTQLVIALADARRLRFDHGAACQTALCPDPRPSRPNPQVTQRPWAGPGGPQQDRPGPAPAAVTEKFGVPPERIPDYLALVGDASDNIPGLKGVGPKTAVKWLAEYGNLEGVLGAGDALQPERFREQVKAEAERIRGNLKLVTFQTDFEFSPGQPVAEDIVGVEAFLSEMEMHSTLRRYQTKHGRASTTPAWPSRIGWGSRSCRP